MKITRVIRILSLGMFVGFGMYLFFRYSWYFSFSRKSQHYLDSLLNHTAPVPDSLLTLYQKIYPDKVTVTINGELLQRLLHPTTFHRINYSCPCLRVTNEDWILKREIRKFDSEIKYSPITALQLAYMAEDLSSPQACFNRALEFEYHQIKGARGYAFSGKELHALTREEFLDYMIAEKAPAYYNPQLHPEQYQKRKAFLQKLISGH